MSESASALFSIADAGEFRFARFYIVYEEVPLGTPESPLIVCGLSDTLRECPNVAKTRNGMPATAWKKYVNFASKNFPPSVYSGTFLLSGLLIILLITQKMSMLIAAVPSYYFSIFANFVYCGNHTRLTVPIGPFLCLAMMISEIPFISES